MRKHKLFVLIIAIVVASLFLGVYAATGGAKGDFARTTIDIGIVVSDVEKAAKFYKDALGFIEVPGFNVSKEMGRDSGLTDSKAFHVKVFVLGDEQTATKVKLMQLPDAPGKKIDNQFIHSTLGFRYLTISVADTNAAVKRAKKASVVPVKEPYQLGGGNNYLTLLKDPDGNIIELVGPKKD